MNRIVRICDAVKSLPMFRADEKEGVFASQLVRHTLAETFRMEFPEFKWANGGLVPVGSGVPEGAAEYSYLEVEHTGKAAIVADNADDIPMADVSGRNNIMPIKTVAIGFTYSTQEVRQAQMQGRFDIASEKAAAARSAHDQEMNELIAVGFPAGGLYGLTNANGILVQQASPTNWLLVGTDAQEIEAAFTAAANTIISESGGVEVPNTALFPLAQWLRISTLPHSANYPGTVLSFLKEAFPMITTWDWDATLATAGTGGTPAALIYTKNPMKARVIIPMALRPMPPEQKNLTFKVVMESRFGGVMAPRPRSILRLEGI